VGGGEGRGSSVGEGKGRGVWEEERGGESGRRKGERESGRRGGEGSVGGGEGEGGAVWEKERGTRVWEEERGGAANREAQLYLYGTSGSPGVEATPLRFALALRILQAIAS